MPPCSQLLRVESGLQWGVWGLDPSFVEPGKPRPSAPGPRPAPGCASPLGAPSPPPACVWGSRCSAPCSLLHPRPPGTWPLHTWSGCLSVYSFTSEVRRWLLAFRPLCSSGLVAAGAATPTPVPSLVLLSPRPSCALHGPATPKQAPGVGGDDHLHSASARPPGTERSRRGWPWPVRASFRGPSRDR